MSDINFTENKINLAGGLPDNSRNSFADLQSQKDVKRNRPKWKHFLNAELLHFKNKFNALLILLAALKHPSVRVTHAHLTLSL